MVHKYPLCVRSISLISHAGICMTDSQLDSSSWCNISIMCNYAINKSPAMGIPFSSNRGCLQVMNTLYSYNNHSVALCVRGPPRRAQYQLHYIWRAQYQLQYIWRAQYQLHYIWKISPIKIYLIYNHSIYTYIIYIHI